MSHLCNFLPRFSLLFHKFGLLFFQYPSLLPNSIYQPLKYIFYCFRHVSPCFILHCIFPALFFSQFLHMLEKFFSRYLFYPFFLFVYFVPSGPWLEQILRECLGKDRGCLQWFAFNWCLKRKFFQPKLERCGVSNGISYMVFRAKDDREFFCRSPPTRFNGTENDRDLRGGGAAS